MSQSPPNPTATASAPAQKNITLIDSILFMHTGFIRVFPDATLYEFFTYMINEFEGLKGVLEKQGHGPGKTKVSDEVPEDTLDEVLARGGLK